MMLRWEFGDHNITEVDAVDSSLVNPFVITHVYYSGQPYSGNVTAFDNNGLYSTYAFQVDVQTLPKTGPPNYALYVGIAVAVLVILAFAAIVVKRRKK